MSCYHKKKKLKKIVVVSICKNLNVCDRINVSRINGLSDSLSRKDCLNKPRSTVQTNYFKDVLHGITCEPCVIVGIP